MPYGTKYQRKSGNYYRCQQFISEATAIMLAAKNVMHTITEVLRQESGGKYRIIGISPGFVNTELTDYIKDEATRSAIKEKAVQIAITPDAIAGAVAYTISQPDNVDAGAIVIRPSIQDNVNLVQTMKVSQPHIVIKTVSELMRGIVCPQPCIRWLL